MQTLEDRVAALEQSKRQWRLGAVLLTLAVGGVAASKPVVSDSIRTRRLEIVNEQDDAAVFMSGKGGGAIALYDEQGTRVFGVSGSKGGGALDLVNTGDGAKTFLSGRGISLSKIRQRETSLVDIGIGDSGGGFVAVNNPTGEPAARIGSNKKNSGVIQTFNSDGSVVGSLGGNP